MCKRNTKNQKFIQRFINKKFSITSSGKGKKLYFWWAAKMFVLFYLMYKHDKKIFLRRYGEITHNFNNIYECRYPV